MGPAIGVDCASGGVAAGELPRPEENAPMTDDDAKQSAKHRAFQPARSGGDDEASSGLMIVTWANMNMTTIHIPTR